MGGWWGLFWFGLVQRAGEHFDVQLPKLSVRGSNPLVRSNT